MDRNKNSDLRGADLRGANFEDANTERAIFTVRTCTVLK
jgi:uncharacterized protein YjbI with pentapeptide repeats